MEGGRRQSNNVEAEKGGILRRGGEGGAEIISRGVGGDYILRKRKRDGKLKRNLIKMITFAGFKLKSKINLANKQICILQAVKRLFDFRVFTFVTLPFHYSRIWVSI